MWNFSKKISSFMKSNRPASFLLLLVLIICFLSIATKMNDYYKKEAFSLSKEDIERKINELQEQMDSHTHQLPPMTLATGKAVQPLDTT